MSSQNSRSRTTVSSGSPLEERLGSSRGVRVGRYLAIAGTAPLLPDGSTACPGDMYGQTRRCLEIMKQAIEDAGGQLGDTVRTRIMLTDMTRWEEAAKAHHEFFSGTRPVCTFVEVKGFIRGDWLVETEADCIMEE
ncbi:RidA family protein [Brevibacillus humidisoli]|uniref:RidA family protein n=1 Tax=Brevibacillus humidisoli TaxID=2895522 RepID=UPI001E3BEBB7|nr:RidA family protein [Brevibacillus humidisoli]UFJ42473.1 RidA family protein [Brevibacillus humidisoli]